MKSILLALFLLPTFHLTVKAQSANPAIWCPAGATWVYNYGVFNEFGTVTVQYQRDTVVAGQPAQILTRVIRSSFWVAFPTVSTPGPAYSLPKVVTRVVNDRVEVQATGLFYTLYDFAAVRGSTWPTPMVTPFGPCASGLAQVTVDSVGRQVVGGRSLRWFRAHLTPVAGATMAGSWTGRIYEQLGNLAQYMQPQSPICHGTDPGYMGAFVGFRAIGWPSIGYNATSGTLLATTQARAEAAGFTVYPNPTAGTGFLTVQLSPSTNPEAQLTVLDITGRPVMQQKAVAGHTMDVRSLAPGIYTLRLSAPGTATLFQRVVLE
ncbi:T9SS type A sorting domain-containing protein [Hymenobacter rubidus]|uniref:T9SS type A sorting domain-containing protein n=1 Tax=Hymenobacter rubidus TaxID=1441626 RepID=UPI00191E9BC4|nr:T9SS type A sorting domain-containing protein [Hymenobacter rubidus]